MICIVNIYTLVMGWSTVLDQGPLGPRVFWAVGDHSKTNPQRPKDRLNKIGECGVCSRECIKKGIQKTTYRFCREY